MFFKVVFVIPRANQGGKKMNRKLKGKIVELYGSQTNFAMKIGEDETFVSRVINGRRRLNEKQQRRWAKALKVNSEDFFDGSPN